MSAARWHDGRNAPGGAPEPRWPQVVYAILLAALGGLAVALLLASLSR